MLDGCVALGASPGGSDALVRLLESGRSLLSISARACGLGDACGQALLRVLVASHSARPGPTHAIEIVELSGNPEVKAATRECVTRAASYNSNRTGRVRLRRTGARSAAK